MLQCVAQGKSVWSGASQWLLSQKDYLSLADTCPYITDRKPRPLIKDFFSYRCLVLWNAVATATGRITLGHIVDRGHVNDVTFDHE